MGKILITFCILFATLSVKAQSVSGIRIDGGGSPILVYMGGSQMSLPTASCFVANLRSGYYVVEVYASRYSRPGERLWKGQKLYSQRVYFNGTGVKDIYVDTGGDAGYDPGTGDRQDWEDGYSDYGPEDNVMSARLFATFYASAAKQASAADIIKMINSAAATSYFTCDQCLRLTRLIKYDHDKMIVMRKMYPRIVDKQAFFTLIGELEYAEYKEEMNTFVKNYNASGQ